MSHVSLPRFAFLFIVISCLLLSLSGIGYTAHRSAAFTAAELLYPAEVEAYHGSEVSNSVPLLTDSGNGIKEDVPEKFVSRYLNWKNEFLSTDAGQKQWAYYRDNPHFTLTITVSRDNAEGATTGKYRWNEAGQLIAATITLGSHLDEGYPNPIYFPVMNSLGPIESSNRTDGSTLAATKLAHEFGHVNRTGKVDPTLYQLQSQLIPQYNKIFLTNGRNSSDPRLLDLTKQIGGTPVEIWEDREYWGEANAMAYLRDRVTEESLRCSLFNRIRRSVDLYAKNYERRFFEIAQATPTSKICGWQ